MSNVFSVLDASECDQSVEGCQHVYVRVKALHYSIISHDTCTPSITATVTTDNTVQQMNYPGSSTQLHCCRTTEADGS